MALFLRLTYCFYIISIKIPNVLLQKLARESWTSYGHARGPRIAKTILRKKKVETLTLFNFRMYWKATVIATGW